jgi:hypothetical protein
MSPETVQSHLRRSDLAKSKGYNTNLYTSFVLGVSLQKAEIDADINTIATEVARHVASCRKVDF